MPVPKTGRQINLERLHQAIRTATTADLQRAAMFLEGARQVRSGSKVQRSNSRKAQSTAWKKNVDDSLTW